MRRWPSPAVLRSMLLGSWWCWFAGRFESLVEVAHDLLLGQKAEIAAFFDLLDEIAVCPAHDRVVVGSQGGGLLWSFGGQCMK